MKSVVFIESNFTGIDAIRSSARAGIKCYLVTSDLVKMKAMLPEDLFVDLETFAEILTVDNSDDHLAVLELVATLPSRPDAVLSFSQFRLVTASRVAKALGLRHAPESALQMTLDKYRLREVMSNAGLPSIRFLKLDRSTAPEKVLNDVGLPCIFKPSRGHSSLSVCLVSTYAELESALSTHQLSGVETIVEEFLEGPLFSLESVTYGKSQHLFWGFTDRELTREFIETGATFPALTPDDHAGRELVAKTLEAIGLDFGSCHTEMIFTAQGPRIVEINPRPGGSGVCRLVSRATGHDVILDYVLMHFGLQPKVDLSSVKAASMRSALPKISGRVTRLPSRSQFLSLKGVQDVWFQRRVGEMTDDSRSNFSWLYTVLAEGRTTDEAARLADLAVVSVDSEIEILPRSGVESCVG